MPQEKKSSRDDLLRQHKTIVVKISQWNQLESTRNSNIYENMIHE